MKDCFPDVRYYLCQPLRVSGSCCGNNYSGSFGDDLKDVIVVDGLFFAVHKKRILEGFDEEFIHTQGVIYGSLVDYNRTHIKMLGCYLTHKINN